MKDIRVLFLILFFASIPFSLQAQNWQRAAGPYGGIMDRMAQDPINGTIYLGTYYAGVYRSTDNGTTWWQTNAALQNANINNLAVDSAGAVHLAASNGYYRSTNGGVTFTQMISGITNTNLYGLLVEGNGTLFVTSGNDGVFRSTNNGLSWSAANNGMTNLQIYTIARDAAGKLYVGSYGGGVFTSMDNGDHWSEADTGITKKNILALLVRGNGNVMAGSDNGGIFESTNGGATWTAAGLSAYINAMEENGAGDVFVGTMGGAYRRSSGQNSWTYISAGLSCNDVYHLFPLKNGRLLAALFGGLGVHASSDKGSHWQVSNTGLTGAIVDALYRMPSGTLYAGMENGGIQHSTDNGASWIRDSTAFNEYSTRAFAALANGDLFAGGIGGVYRSTDGGQSWQQSVTGMTGTNVFCMMAEGGTLFAGTIGSLFRSTNNGTSWIKADSGLTGKPVMCLAALPGGDLLAGENPGGVFRSTDGGNFWMPSDSGLANFQISRLMVDPGGTVFLGTNGGLYRSSNGGAVWQYSALSQFASDMLETPTGLIYVANQGSGVWVSTNGGLSWAQVNNGLTSTNVSALALTADNYLVAGTRAFSTFRSSFAVPVELLSFTAQLRDGRVRLSWSTASETDNLGFRIERSPSGGAPSGGGWEDRGFVQGHGFAAGTNNYEYTDDPSPMPENAAGPIYYRLRQMDADGSSNVSDAVEVDMRAAPAALALMQNSPNPFGQRTTIAFDIPGGAPLHARLAVRDLLGRELFTVAEGEYPPGRHEVSFAPPAAMRSGTYFAVLETAGGRLVRRMELLR